MYDVYIGSFGKCASALQIYITSFTWKINKIKKEIIYAFRSIRVALPRFLLPPLPFQWIYIAIWFAKENCSFTGKISLYIRTPTYVWLNI